MIKNELYKTIVIIFLHKWNNRYKIKFCNQRKSNLITYCAHLLKATFVQHEKKSYMKFSYVWLHIFLKPESTHSSLFFCIACHRALGYNSLEFIHEVQQHNKSSIDIRYAHEMLLSFLFVLVFCRGSKQIILYVGKYTWLINHKVRLLLLII